MLLLDKGHKVIIVIHLHLKHILRASLNAFGATIALVRVDDKVIVARAISVAVVGNIARHDDHALEKPGKHA
jgi:hypothetical protein